MQLLGYPGWFPECCYIFASPFWW